MTLSGYGYKCSGGETFDSIALEVYGAEKYSAELLCANPALCGIQVFEGGELVLLPVVEILGANSGTDDAMPEKAPWKEA